MDTRILLHYLSRGGWVVLVYTLYFLYGFVSNSAETDIVPHVLTLMGIPLMSTVYISLRKQQWRQIFNLLPISSLKLAGTIWMMGVGLTLISLYIGLTASVAYLKIYEPDITIVWNRYYALMVCGTLLTTSIFLIEIPWPSISLSQKIKVITFKTILALYPVFLFIFWETSQFITILACLLAVLQFTSTLIVSPHAARSGFKNSYPSIQNTVVRKHQSELKLNFFDRWYAKPVQFASIYGITASILTLTFRHQISALPDDYEMMITLFLFILSSIVTVILCFPISSMRSIANLPIQKSKILCAIILVPCLTFLPIATGIIFLTIPYFFYIAPIACCVTMCALFLRWNNLVSLFFLNTFILIISLALWFGRNNGLPILDVFYFVSLITFPLFIVAPTLWIWHLLRNTPYPYQTKTVCSNC